MPAFVQQLNVLKDIVTPRRSEEKHKFLFRKYFRYLQGDFTDPAKSFANVFASMLSSEFSSEESSVLFRPVVYPKVKGSQPPGDEPPVTFCLPTTYNKKFVARLLTIPQVRASLLEFMDGRLLEVSKREVRCKILALVSRFRSFFEKVNIDLFTKAIGNYVVEKNLSFWSLKEVQSLIESVKERLGGIGRAGAEVGPTGPGATTERGSKRSSKEWGD